MIHQPSGGAEGQASDIIVTNRELQRLKELTTGILASHTGKSLETVSKDILRDHYMGAEEALAYGIVDKVMKKNG